MSQWEGRVTVDHVVTDDAMILGASNVTNHRHSVLIPVKKILCCLFGGLCLLLWTSLGFAENLPGCQVVLPRQPQTSDEWLQVREQMSARLSQCESAPGFLALYGAAQLNTGALNESMQTLERALMLDPFQGSAQVDYAQALYLSGQPFAALALNHDLLQSGHLPPALKTRLQHRARHWRESLSYWQHQFALSFGRDSNLNSAPHDEVIRLTMPTADFALSLDGDDRPQSGNIVRLAWGSLYEKKQLNGARYFKLNLNSRNTPDSDYNAHQGSLRFGRRYEHAYGEWDLSMTGQMLQYGGHLLYSSLEGDVSWQSEEAYQGCRIGADFEYEYQRFPSNRTLDGRESRLGPTVGCRWGQITLDLSLLGLLNDSVNHNRIGGDRNGWQSQWQLGMPLVGGRLNASFSWTQLRDKEGYSPLLAHGSPRRIRQFNYGLQYLYPISSHQAITLGAQRRMQRSNLQLFEHQNTQYEVGILWIF